MSNVVVPLVILLLIDAAFLVVAFALMVPLSKYKHAAYAVMKRNFAGYFSNPTGYLFILLFVGVSSLCAFFPYDFFNDNLATLHELNRWFPWIMLIYVPTITMGIWAEEKRQGTDELLLTVPADDWDIVIGKYLAAAAIYTVSLLFSQVSNFLVLATLAEGDLDIGLFVTTYLGYWFVGLSMIALGMVGSFLTRNQTIGFIFGVLLNLPLVLSSYADAIASGAWSRWLGQFSYSQQFADFGRGVISLRAIVFFGMLIAIGLYLSVVLVGRRHWLGGKDGQSMAGHYLIRAISLVAIALGATFFFVNHDLFRVDGTSQKISSLSKDTKTILASLESPHTILIEAFISSQIPEDYTQVKVDLISKLNELKAKGGNKIEVRIYDNVEPFSDAAERAEEQYGIRPSTVLIRERGTMRQQEIFLGAAFTCGLERVIVPFFDQGIPVEYELTRSIDTVSQQKRKRMGIVRTDAQMMGGFDMQRMSQVPKQLIVEEWEKQYEVISIDPNNSIQDELDVMLVVQPSSLTQPQLDNVIAKIRTGTPTALFEDPMPVMMSAPGTSQPKPPQGGMMGMGGAPPEPKGDIRQLWEMLGIQPVGQDLMGQFNADVIWQDYNPYEKTRGFRQITKEWVFVGPSVPNSEDPLSSSQPVTSGLRQLLMLYPGAFKVSAAAPKQLSIEPLVTTGPDVGTISQRDLTGATSPAAVEFNRRRSVEPFMLAARIQSNPSDASEATAEATTPNQDPAASADGQPTAETPPADKINVIYVNDIDMVHSEFIRVRAQPNMSDINWQFDNVTFALNVVDELANEPRFLEIRKRQTRHSTLKKVERRIAEARETADEQMTVFNEEFERLDAEARKKQQEAMAELQKEVDSLREKATSGDGTVSARELQRTLQAALQQLSVKEQVEQRRLDAQVENLNRKRESDLQKIERELDSQIRHIQNVYKSLALLLPMLPPLAVGLVVFARRRARESEGIASERRR